MHSVTDPTVSQPGTAPHTAPQHDDGRAFYIQGLMALRDGRSEVAASLLIRALRRQPTHLGMRRNLVRALLSQGQFDQVLPHADVALAAAPNDAELHFARGTALNGLGRAAAACAAFNRAITLQPGHAPSWLNYGNASVDLDNLDAAEALYRAAIRLDPGLPEAHASLGYVLTLQGRLQEAIDACEAAIRLHPEFVQAQWNRAIATLLSGDLRRGFAQYEWRKRHPSFRADFPPLPGPRWDGGNPSGMTILVRAEQGIGDAIQFARYLPVIRAMGGSPILACNAGLVTLIKSMPGVRATAAVDLPHYDAWTDQMSLPCLLGTTLDTIPSPTGYLAADPRLISAWADRLPADFKVGIAVCGNQAHPADRRRSIPPDVLTSLPSIPGVSFVNLQHGQSAARLPLEDLTRWMPDYAETAALIANLDLVVSVDTSVAHLAAALGKPTWIMLPTAPDWRWMLDRQDSPWYGTARLFRQRTAGDWSDVLARVFSAIEARD